MTRPTAFARPPGPAMPAATSEATPKNAPCGRPLTKRKPDQHREARRQAAGDIAQPEDRQQQQQEIAPREFRAEDRKYGRADHHAERVSADDVPGLRNGDAEPVGDARQETHGGELAGADGETADGERRLRAARARASEIDADGSTDMKCFPGCRIDEAAENPPPIDASMPGARSAINGENRNVIAESSRIRDVVWRP